MNRRVPLMVRVGLALIVIFRRTQKRSLTGENLGKRWALLELSVRALQIGSEENIRISTRKIVGLAILVLSFAVYIPRADAQSASAYIAGGTAVDSSAGPVDTFGAGTIYQAPRLSGTFETIGGDFVFFHNLGVGAEVSYRRNKGGYAGLQYAPSFFDVNAVYRPWSFTRRIRPEFQIGYGRADLNLYLTPQICATLPQGCGATNGEVTSVNDSQLHFAWGLRVYAYRGLFVRPQMDVRWVPNNFSSYFGSSWIAQYSLGIGYTLNLSKWLGWRK